MTTPPSMEVRVRMDRLLTAGYSFERSAGPLHPEPQRLMHEGRMSAYVWWFLREGEGRFRPLSHKKWRDFFTGRYGIKPDDGFVRIVLVGVEMENRRARALTTLEFTKWAVDENGFHDGYKSTMEACRALARATYYEHQAREAGVLSAAARIERKRILEKTLWKPRWRDAEALREAINRKASSHIA